MLEECRLKLSGNSDEEKMGWQRRGGGIALKSREESIITIVSNSPAAALVVAVRESGNITTIKAVPARSPTRFCLGIFGPEHDDRWGGEKAQNKAAAKMIGGAEKRRKTKPTVKVAT